MNKLSKERGLVIAVSIFLVLLLFVSNGYRFTPTGNIVSIDSLDSALENKDELMQMYNSNLDNVPNFVKTIFGDELIDVSIVRGNGSIVSLSAETKKGAIVRLSEERFSSYTLKVKVSEETIDMVVSSENQVAALKKALDDGSIEYEALTFTTSVKTGVSRVFLSLFSLFK